MKQTDSQPCRSGRLRKLARRLDRVAVRLARGRPAIDVAQGEIFLRLSVGNRLIELKFSRKVNFANEARVVARRAPLADVRARIAAAAETTSRQVQGVAADEKAQEDRRANRRKVRGPAEALRALMRAADSARQFFALAGEAVGEGEVPARVADHLFSTYEVPVRWSERPTRWLEAVLLRRCGVCVGAGWAA